MKKVLAVFAVVALLAMVVAAQTAVGSQGNVAASGKTSVTAGQGGASVKGDAAVSARQKADVEQGNSGGSAEARGEGSGEGSVSASAPAGDAAQGSMQGETTIHAVLAQSLDAKKAKAGDQVVAKVASDVKSEGRVIIPRKSKLIGRVAEAKARGEGRAESSLAIVFDKAVTRDGREVPLNATIQALAASRAAAGAAMPHDDVVMGSTSGAAYGGGSARSGLLGGTGAAVGSVTNTAADVSGGVGNTAASLGSTASGAVNVGAGAAGGLDAAGRLTSSSQGVFGLDGLNLTSTASNGTKASVITSTTGNVKLESGTQMVLRARQVQ